MNSNRKKAVTPRRIIVACAALALAVALVIWLAAALRRAITAGAGILDDAGNVVLTTAAPTYPGLPAPGQDASWNEPDSDSVPVDSTAEELEEASKRAE